MWGYDYLEILSNIAFIVGELARHGTTGYVVFVLAFFLTSSSQFLLYLVMGYGRRSPVNTEVARFIMRSSLFLAFLLAVLSHLFVDGLFNTPLSPPLDLQL